MKKAIVLGLLALCAIISVISCNKLDSSLPGGNTTVYLDLPDSVYQYVSFSNIENHKVTLGRVLFYDRHLSVNNSISCGTCHKQAYAFSDNKSFSRGFENKETGRNTPPIQNLGFSGFLFCGTNNAILGGSLFWDGREQDIKNLIARPISNHVEMGIENLATLPDKLVALPYYSKLFTAAYGSSEITMDRISDAVADFTTAITANKTRLDLYNQGKTNLTALELQGQQLFTQKYNCAGCHATSSGGYFSGTFMNIGLDEIYSDKGLGAITRNASDNGRFKIPNLRNVALTAPYMHDGRFKTLDDVLEHYSHGIKNNVNLDPVLKDNNGQPIRMSIPPQERQAIIAFLNALTDVDMITNPYLSDPFKTK